MNALNDDMVNSCLNLHRLNDFNQPKVFQFLSANTETLVAHFLCLPLNPVQ